jgi:hypothetical protein
MNNTTFFWPAFALVLLTFTVMMRMMFSRIAMMKVNRIHPQSISTSAELIAKMPDTRASDNFRNLFETPILFYAALAFAQFTQPGNQPLLVLASFYVAIRIVHSYIQCTYNKVMHRFYVFLASVSVLLAMWAILAIGFLK